MFWKRFDYDQEYLYYDRYISTTFLNQFKIF